MSLQKIKELNISQSQDFFEKIDGFATILLEWNKVHNLSGSFTKESVFAQVYDSLFPMSFYEGFEGNALDIGSGAGFPAIPLAIAMPSVSFTLVEPSKKRVSFLNYLKIKLKLNNVTIVDKRIEECEKKISHTITTKAVMDADRILALVGD
ncbi:MAG: rRNA (guanine527-N7)-methyltransferase, partial [Campylobacterota bacterium]|nr:rRNA (guanine527-N7)-methyltransferase [Campylobacterota bacterium]